ncbi:site-2 protease family protein [Streptomyces doudnae]|uniref:Site-2 protease family protein n=1 Tax=Streptomyces doudnae TaxID=3075536 RepID=A0ABD5EU16_9ACTN|nr:site-2 protease family protein [Streptomyces sp. DSM 41981]MDT0437489.1 site-2 protease family protein [Streptomyces sp. DSM 41981]
MDETGENGGSRQPRSDTDESAARPGTPGTADDHPTDVRRPQAPGDGAKGDAAMGNGPHPPTTDAEPTPGTPATSGTDASPTPGTGTPAAPTPPADPTAPSAPDAPGLRQAPSAEGTPGAGQAGVQGDGDAGALAPSGQADTSGPGRPDTPGDDDARTPGSSGQAGTPGSSGQAGTPGSSGQAGVPGPGQASTPGAGQAGTPAPGQAGTPGTSGQGDTPDPTGPPPASHPTPEFHEPHEPHEHRSLAHSGNEGGGGDGGKRPPRRTPEPRGGLLMGRPFGVPVYVAPSWFLVAALITWVFGGQLERVLPELGAARYLVSLFFAVAFYASVLVHELAHTVAALRFKLPVRRIQLQFFGGVSEIEKEAETPGREFVLAFVGPLLSLVLSGVFYLALLPVEPGTVPGVLLAGLMISNLIVAAFNLLPGLPLDGGRMLRAVVWKITGKPMSGTVAAAWVGRALAVSVLIGLPLLTQSGALGATAEDNVGMDTVTDALLAAILAAIIWTGAGNSLRMARLREHLPELRARNLTRRAVPVETDTPLSEALRRANAAGARALVVVDPDGTPLSLVREAAIVGVPEHRRPWVAVSGLAQDLTDGMRVSAELAGEDLLDALRATPATEYLVVEETGAIYGVLSAADVERAFVKAMARPS